ncbi:hypothetical protein [Pseudonocardia sp. ICBG601]|uniref:hypothetical protein n=1 Tax=Pseudonocardia sp. ICBG601 TaxID=2846759 RepID=UPI0021F503A3|nr:hypothetical protein [Pseudonocardia sp. ICBG601]
MEGGGRGAVAGADPSATPGLALRDALGEVGKLGWTGFPAAVHGAYQALVLAPGASCSPRRTTCCVPRTGR